MSRTIKESLDQLETSLSDIKTSLANKKVEGGGSLKVSEVAGMIDQIEVGSSTTPFKYIEYVEFQGTKYYDSPAKLDFVQSYYNKEATIKIKNFGCICYSSNLTGITKNEVNENDLLTVTNDDNWGVVIVGRTGEYQNADMPDIVIFAPYYDG